MNWLSKNLWGEKEQQKEVGDEQGEEDPCNGCGNPCEDHANYPSSLVKRINQSTPLSETGPAVKGFKQHILICEGTDEKVWPEKIGKIEGSLEQSLSKQLKKNAEILKISYPVLVTVGDIEPEDTGLDHCKASTYDFIIFPAGVKYVGVNVDNLDKVLRRHFIGETPEPPISVKTELPHKYHLLICTHKKRDNRCGVAGNMLVDEFNKYLAENGLSSEFCIVRTSHFGGHKYAGNVIVYPGGIWYGRVIPCHVPKIVTSIKQGTIIKKLWRGTMPALDAPEQKDMSW